MNDGAAVTGSAAAAPVLGAAVVDVVDVDEGGTGITELMFRFQTSW